MLRDMQYTYSEALRIKGLVLFALGHMKESLVWLQEALQTCKSFGITNNIPILETELGVVYRRLGEPEITAQYYASALQAWENAGNTGWKARLLNNLGMLYHMTGRLPEAYPLLQEALKTSERSGYARIQTNVLISLGDLLTDLSDYTSAYSYYDNALTLASSLGHSLYIFYASVGLARLQRLKGNPSLAVDELRRAELSQVNLGIFERAIFNLELGCCWLDSNKVELAIDILRESVALFGQGGNQMEQAVAQLWLEVASSVQNSDQAAEKLKDLLPVRREWQKPTPQMIHAGRAARWLKKRGSPLFKDPALKSFFEHGDRVRELLPGMRRNLTGDSRNPQAAVPRLEISSFGDIVVRHNQRVVELSDWQTREARDLFLFLLQSPALTKEQIALAFWPDISPARLKVRFKINVYRIRQAIGQDVIVFEDDRYRFNRAINYTWDREEFDKLFEKLRQSLGPAEKRKLLEQVVALIAGDYLADLDADWVMLDRLKYQETYRYLMLEMAAQYLQDGQAHDCLNTARRVLLSDPLLESAHRLIIQAYASLHDPANMTLQYRRYQQALANELGLEPSLEMSALYEQLLAAI